MSLLSQLGIGVAASALDTVLLVQHRRIAHIIPDVVIEEHHRDEIEVTSHPIERGAPISDHAFKRPRDLVMVVGWSNSYSYLGRVKEALSGGSLFTDRIRDSYEQLLRLQHSYEPFRVVCGKRAYNNMLLHSVSTTTNRDTEHSLIVECVFRECLIVSTKVADRRVTQYQSLPAKTADVDPGGTVQAQPVDDMFFG